MEIVATLIDPEPIEIARIIADLERLGMERKEAPIDLMHRAAKNDGDHVLGILGGKKMVVRVRIHGIMPDPF